MQRRWLQCLGFIAWTGVYAAAWIRLGGFAASAVCLAATAIIGLAWYSRFPAPPGRRSALVGVLLIAGWFGLAVVIPDGPTRWWSRAAAAVGAVILFGGGIVLISSESAIAVAERAQGEGDSAAT